MIILVLYILFSHLYAITLYYGILGRTSNGDPITNPISIVINGMIYSTLFLLMIIAHVQCVITNPGALPRNYEKLNEA
jgi:hypothetical protein